MTKKILIQYSDVDECATNEHDCDENAICENTGDSFTCSCKDGYHGNGKTCLGKNFHIHMPFLNCFLINCLFV